MQSIIGYMKDKNSAPAIIAKQLAELMAAVPELNTQVKLAKRTGIGQTTIGRIRRGEVETSAENLRLIAKAFNVPVGYLYGQMSLRDTSFDVEKLPAPAAVQLSGNVAAARTRGRLPLISWVQAGNWSEIVDNFQPGDAEDWIPCPFSHGEHAFILRVVGHSMYNPGGDRSYAPGEFIAVDPSAEPLNKRMVVVKLDGEDRATFKQLLVDNEGNMALQALNPSFSPRIMEMPKGSRIVGVVIGKWVPE